MKITTIVAWLDNLVNSSIERPAGHLGGLDALRFISVYCILLSHQGFRVFSGFGVPILMALSGFLITRQLLREYRRTQHVRVNHFIVGRFLRIAPAYFIFVGVTWLADSLTGNTWPPDLIWYALTHTVNYFNATHGHPDLSMAHVWTLSILEQFYLVWPLVFSLIVSGKYCMRIIIALIVIGLIWRIYAYTVVFPDNVAWIYNALDCRLDSILFGCATAVWFEQNPDRLNRLKPDPAALVLIALIQLVFIAYSNDYKPWHYRFGYLFEAAAAMILIFTVSRMAALEPFRWIDSRLFIWLGKISYPLFLYHILAIGLTAKLVDEIYLRVIIATAISILTAAGSYYIIESPALRLRLRLRAKWGY